MKHISAREKVDSAPLDADSIRRTVRPLFRRKNDYGDASFGELPAELSKFGIATVKDLRLLMKKHRRTLLTEENVKMCRAETLWLASEGDFSGIDTLSGKSWFALPGLVRSAMELEFGDDAAVYVSDQQAYHSFKPNPLGGSA